MVSDSEDPEEHISLHCPPRKLSPFVNTAKLARCLQPVASPNGDTPNVIYTWPNYCPKFCLENLACGLQLSNGLSVVDKL